MSRKWQQNGKKDRKNTKQTRKRDDKLVIKMAKIMPIKMALKWRQNGEKIRKNGDKLAKKWRKNGDKMAIKMSKNGEKKT